MHSCVNASEENLYTFPMKSMSFESAIKNGNKKSQMHIPGTSATVNKIFIKSQLKSSSRNGIRGQLEVL